MTLKLTRDQARNVQLKFFPFLDLYCKMRIERSTTKEEEISCKIIFLLLIEIRHYWEQKLFGTSNKISLEFTAAECLVLSELLPLVPLDPMQSWLFNLRQFILDTLQEQIPATA